MVQRDTRPMDRGQDFPAIESNNCDCTCEFLILLKKEALYVASFKRVQGTGLVGSRSYRKEAMWPSNVQTMLKFREN